MTSNDDTGCEGCIMHYVAAGAVVAIFWILIALALLIYKLKKEVSESSTNTDDVSEDNLEMQQENDNIYSQVAFNDNKNPEKQDPADHLVYSSIVFNGNKTPKSTCPKKIQNDVTYASVNISTQPKVESSQLYATVKKKS